MEENIMTTYFIALVFVALVGCYVSYHDRKLAVAIVVGIALYLYFNPHVIVGLVG